MPTVVTSADPYCDPAALLRHCDRRQVADWAAERDGPRPTRAALLDPTDPAGATVLAQLRAASGQVEEACLRGGRYTPADLAALTGNARATLEQLVAGLALPLLAGRRSPGAADRLPLVEAAARRLEDLRTGALVFGLRGPIDAGSGPAAVVVQQPEDATRTVVRAGGFFGNRSRG